MIILNKKWFSFFPGLLIGTFILAFFPLITQADCYFCSRTGEKNIYIGSEEVIESNFIQTGGIIDFDGQAQKDVIIAGGTVNVTGPVKGDVIVAGGNVKIKGEVEGNVRVVGGTVEISNKVGKNVNAFGGIIIIDQNAEIGWDVLIGAGSVEIRGKVGGDVKGGAGSVVLASEINGNVDLKLDPEDGQLILYPQADIKGNLKYSAPQEAEIKEGAYVAGETFYEPIVPPVAPFKKSFEVFSLLRKVLGLLALIVVGLIIILLARKKSKEIGERMLDNPWSSLGWGLIYLIITPVVLILIAITLIGIPLSLIILVFYLIALYITKVFVGIALGRKLLKWWKKGQEVSLVWAMILGVILFSIFTSLPFIGWIILFLGTCWALGSMIETGKKALIKR